MSIGLDAILAGQGDISRVDLTTLPPLCLFQVDRRVCGRAILIEKSYLDQIVHVPKLFSLLHWSQNIFCFLCSSTPSHVGKFFRLQWEFQWENDQNKKNGQKSLFRGPKWFPKCLNRGFRGGICIEKWSWNFDSGTRSAIFGTPKIAKNTY